jgi:hypothetical protein
MCQKQNEKMVTAIEYKEATTILNKHLSGVLIDEKKINSGMKKGVNEDF